ncbi:transposable element Tc1 transposase [Trichonephila clavipes]|nr:transposable element Tc1 transposase [Trichonephila clavipes]
MVWAGIMLDGREPLHVFERGSVTGVRGIRRMDWPSRSPDLNPIKNVWDVQGEGNSNSQPPPITIPEMKTAFLNE